jgi:tetratricopeptide (TPR) repeat protein
MEAIKTRPDHAGLHVRLGRRLEAAALRAPADGPERKAALEGALKAYEKAAELNPEAWSAHFRCGEIHLELGRPKEATPCFERATGLFPGFVLWSLAEAEAKALSGDVAGAATAFLRYAGRFESDPLVRGLFERLDSRGAKYLDAFDAALRKACEAEKSNAYLRSNLAYVALKRNDAETARRAAIEAESLGLVGRMGVHAHAVLREAFGLSLTPETTPAPKPKGS